MQKAKTFNIENSNIALIGSDLDHQARLKAAQTEEAWKGAGKENGIQIWRIEQFKVVHWPKNKYGTFYSGDSYIVLHTYDRPAQKDLDKKTVKAWDIHFWIGNESSQDEYGTAAYKTVELDDYLGGEPVEYREIQGHESQKFLSHFPKIQFLSGGVATGFKHAEKAAVRTRLLHIKGKHNIIVREVPCERASLNSGDVFLLEHQNDIYQFQGKQSGLMEKNKAAQIAQALDDERGGTPVVHVIREDDKDADAEAFWKVMGGRGPIKSSKEGGEDDKAIKFDKKLFRLSDKSGNLQFSECKVDKSSLDGSDVFIYDAGYQVFVWVGTGASKAEKANGIAYATNYLFKYGRDRLSTPICRVLQGA
jgi:gelsolin